MRFVTITLALALALALAGCASTPPNVATPLGKAKSMAEVIAAAPPQAWRQLAPERLLVMQTAAGQVVIELAEAFAPEHAKNLKIMVSERYFDGLAITRSQDNFVVQWGDPNAEDADKRKSLGSAQKTLAPEFEAPIQVGADFVRLPDIDGFAAEVGFSHGFAVGRDPRTGTMWPAP
jgi:peptidylprolyl isomerase